jgi:hypothetical protein
MEPRKVLIRLIAMVNAPTWWTALVALYTLPLFAPASAVNPNLLIALVSER